MHRSVGIFFVCRDYARTLQGIVDTMGESLNRGPLAEKIVTAAQAAGGSMSAQDLAGHRGSWVTPLRQEYHGIELCEIPPEGQGIAALIALGIMRHLDMTAYTVDSVDATHLQLEAMKIAFVEIFHHLADPQSMQFTTKELLDEDFLKSRAAEISMHHAADPQAHFLLDAGTVYVTAADGMMVLFLQSNFMGFCSGIVIPDTGISMQNRGVGFLRNLQHANCIVGEKLPDHTIISGFVMKNQQPLMSLGVMGGHMQAQGHLQVFLRIVDYQQNPQKTAIDAPRWYIAEDFSVGLEERYAGETTQDLRDRGHHIQSKSPFFAVHK